MDHIEDSDAGSHPPTSKDL